MAEVEKQNEIPETEEAAEEVDVEIESEQEAPEEQQPEEDFFSET